eukprot:TRINITY_DN8040_c0_g1_i2.p1 TRINITY_DN8040_c0_g1~~TRINITY_DN8040_c0_g1_i2.p1  ORF type:complete len:236 (+),score=62.12 TRINITY_DN8040_c0_g1_i2:46-708(+)
MDTPAARLAAARLALLTHLLRAHGAGAAPLPLWAGMADISAACDAARFASPAHLRRAEQWSALAPSLEVLLRREAPAAGPAGAAWFAGQLRLLLAEFQHFYGTPIEKGKLALVLRQLRTPGTATGTTGYALFEPVEVPGLAKYREAAVGICERLQQCYARLAECTEADAAVQADERIKAAVLDAMARDLHELAADVAQRTVSSVYAWLNAPPAPAPLPSS